MGNQNGTDNKMKKDIQLSTKNYTENRLSNTNTTKFRGVN